MSFELTQGQALETARKSQPAPNSSCALKGCNIPLPDPYGFVLWSDHPEDDRFCSKECSLKQWELVMKGTQ